MSDFTIQWATPVENHITWKWLAKTTMWSVIVAYVPNIIWYMTGPHKDAVIVQFIIMLIGMPLVMGLSIRSYRKQEMTVLHRVSGSRTQINIYEEMVSDSGSRYDTYWQMKPNNAEYISFSDGNIIIKGIWKVLVYEPDHKKPVITEETEKEFVIPYHNDYEIKKFIQTNYMQDGQTRRERWQDSTDRNMDQQ